MTQIFRHPSVQRIGGFLFGSRAHRGFTSSIVLYALLIAIGFIYLQPLLFMFITSIKSPTDLLNPMVQWVPTELYLGNYEKGLRVLNYSQTLLTSILISVVPSLLQTMVASIVGYGLARYRFW
ncbi:MAG: carbohydrate ABC transporter permease, partial [Anaerolineae bacterium]|nr:carbohydrate ABC transporter permease [Anaerolineae bacterium]